MAAVDAPALGFFAKHKKVIIGISILLALVIIALGVGLAFGLKSNTTFDTTTFGGKQAPNIKNTIEYVAYEMKPMGDVVFTELECEACTSILNLGSAGMSKDFKAIDVRDMKLVVLDSNLIITDLVAKSENRPIMFYGNAKDPRISNKSIISFTEYFRYDRPFFLNFTEITKGFWSLQCDFLSTYIDIDSPNMLIQLCILGDDTFISVKANTFEVSPVIKASLLKYRIFAKNAENVIVIDNNPLSIKNQWVAIVCPSADTCRTSCTICKATVPDYRNRKNTAGELLESNATELAFGKEVPYIPKKAEISNISTIPGTTFLLMGDMVLTRVVIASTNMPKMVEIITDSITGDESLVPVPINFVQNTEGMWEWDVDIVYNHLRRKIYIQSPPPYPNVDVVTATMTMYYIEPEDLPLETADFIRKGYIAQRGNTFLENAAFTDCACT